MNLLAVIFGLTAAAFGYAWWRHWREFRKLRRWASQSRLAEPPEAEGAWGEVFGKLHRHRRATLLQRRQLARLIVRTRRGLQALPYGVVILDAKYRLDWCNHAARDHLGLDPVQDRGQPIVNFVRDPQFVAYMRDGDFSEPLQLGASASRARTLSLQIVSFGQEEHLLLSQDVSAAERIESMRRDFVANVSHELRTPLTVLAGFLETIQDLDLGPERVRDYVNLMAPQADRMKRLVEDLLTLSALEHAPPPATQRVRMRPLLERLLPEAQALSGRRHRISLEIEAAWDLMAAESEIASGFLNLVSNAVRYTPHGGEIRIRWSAEGEGAEFSVQDTGIGIAPEHLPRLTERFYRVDRSRSRESGGTGLGLSIVKHVAARHQAVLDVRSEPGKGSRFSMRFPASRLVAAEQKVTG